jgi:hypothetical protein
MASLRSASTASRASGVSASRCMCTSFAPCLAPSRRNCARLRLTVSSFVWPEGKRTSHHNAARTHLGLQKMPHIADPLSAAAASLPATTSWADFTINDGFSFGRDRGGLYKSRSTVLASRGPNQAT